MHPMIEDADVLIAAGWGDVDRPKIPEDWETITPRQHRVRLERQKRAEANEARKAAK